MPDPKPAFLSQREFLGELMDDPDLDPQIHARALAGLKRINTVTNSYGPLWKAMRKLSSQTDEPLRILDVACGGGDSLKTIAKLAARDRRAVHLTGFDISPTAIEIASKECAGVNCPLDFVVGDAVAGPLPADQDVVFCSLFLHHLPNDAAIQLLKNMSQAAQQLMIVSDLQRTRAGYAWAWYGTRLLSRSPIVHTDGPRSVQSAVTLDELKELTTAAGIPEADIANFWPERFLLTWSPE